MWSLKSKETKAFLLDLDILQSAEVSLCSEMLPVDKASAEVTEVKGPGSIQGLTQPFVLQ